ncbi:MAG: hypothetical protein Q4F49_01825 [Pseudoxanthomonas suwonensis]|nr:hypothetical protein [Pseudoxanthomonas suwonensis]
MSTPPARPTTAADEGLDDAVIRAFGALLVAHVRFEDRQCFLLLQRAREASPQRAGPDAAGSRTSGQG